ncbi:MAG: hypothetical protein QOJ13_111 [Gaiellales bacterium]|nr:hypothetical protein [Gaiellales bacterium]
MGIFDHPANEDLIEFLEGQAEPSASMDLDGFELHAHPDLCERLIGLANELEEVPDGWHAVYGVPALATSDGVIYAFAIGVGGIGLRLPHRSLHRHLNRHDLDLPGWTVIDARQSQLPGRVARERLRESLLAAHAASCAV